MYRYNTYIAVFIILSVISLIPAGAKARLTDVGGAISLGYEDYDVKYTGGVGGGESRSFYQIYDLNAGLAGNLYNERSALYNINLLYSYADYENRINGEGYSLNSGTLSWSGDLNLRLYHLNNFQVTFYGENNEYRIYDYSQTGGELGGGFETDVDKKAYERSGFYGSMGDYGGTTYYFSYYNEQLDGVSDYEERTEAGNFSINNGVNWLTVSRTVFKPGDLEEFVLQVGNVGTKAGRGSRRRYNFPKRYWYRLSNWLSISTDYLYSKRKSSTAELEANRLTFAMKGTRKNWNVYTLSTYGQSSDGNINNYDLRLPLWINTLPSTKTQFGIRSAYYESGETNEATATEKKDREVKEELILWARPKSDFAVESRYSFRKSDPDDQDTRTDHTFQVKGYTDRREEMNYRFSYDFKLTKTEETTSSYSHILNGYLSYLLGPGKSLGINQTVGFNYSKNGIPDEKSRQVDTVVYFNTKVGEKSSFASEISRSLLKYDEGSELIRDEADLDFKSRINSKTLFRSFLDYRRTDSDVTVYGYDVNDENYRSETELTYKESKELISTTTFTKLKNIGYTYVSESQIISETLEYNYFRSGYDRRTIVTSRAGLSYGEEKTAAGKDRYGSYYISIRYFPLRHISCGASYSVRDSMDNTHYELNSGLNFEVTYPLLSFGGSYNHREYENNYSVEEDKYQFNLRKKF